MNRTILMKIESVKGQLGAYGFLGQESFQANMDEFLARSRDLGDWAVVDCDVQDSEAEDVRRWFQSLPVAPDSPVVVLWPSSRTGISTNYACFVDVYDDLWWPAVEDVWVRSIADDWMLELDHEEIFRFFSSPAVNLDYRNTRKD